MTTKRLFLFAAYDRDGVIDATLVHYVRALATLGDVVFTMDNDATPDQIAKISEIPNVLHATATRHGEYDFGSYKRGYQWARDKKILNKYDWVYLVNDSVYGPLFDVKPILESLESRGADLTGMADYVNARTPVHVQSWFVGVSHNIVLSDYFNAFMESVSHQPEKTYVILKYEVGMSQMLLRHGAKMAVWCDLRDQLYHVMYLKPLKALMMGIPFIKKQAIGNIPDLMYLAPYCDTDLIDAIHLDAIRHNMTVNHQLTNGKQTPYEKHFRFTLFGIPLITVYVQPQTEIKITSYKIYIFDKLPIAKVAVRK